MLWSLLSAFFFQQYVCTTVVVRGSSMSPTLKEGDTFIIERLSSHLKAYKRGEIVVIHDGHQGYAVKRIVGLPSEYVSILRNRVYINGRPLHEDYLPRRVLTYAPKSFFKLEENQYFMLGDNREESFDSRNYGALQRDHIIGSVSRSLVSLH